VMRAGAAAGVRSHGKRMELLDIVHGRERNPELRILTFNGATGVLTHTDHAHCFKAKSITIYNPNQATVYVGFGGDSATPLANALPVFQFATFPLQADDLNVGFQATDLGQSTATVFVFRWPTVRDFAAE
jgi:hypothetical protein